MMYFIFQSNHNILFYVNEGSLEVSHSFIDHLSSSISTSISVSTESNNTLTNRITYQIQFFNSYLCETDIPQPGNKHMSTIDQKHLICVSFINPMLIIMFS